MIERLDTLRNVAGQVESVLTDAVAKVAPWAAPIPTAYLVGKATVAHLRWPTWVGIVAAVIVESLGLATTATALELREYNQGKRKSDPPAPFPLAALLVAVYLVVAVGLTVALDIAPVLAAYSPAVFPLLSLCGVTTLAIRGDHRRRVGAIEAEKARRRAARRAKRKEAVSKDVKINATVNTLTAAREGKRQERLDALVDYYRDNPDADAVTAGEVIGVCRQTVYTYQSELEQAGRLRRNGDGWEVAA